MAKWREALEKIRVLIDGENPTVETTLEEITKSVKTSRSERFRDKIVNEIDSVLRDEIIRFPSGKVYVPSNFTVLISEIEARDLRDDKRRFLEMAIGELMLERAKTLAETDQVSAKNIGINIKVDATLEEGKIEVRAISDSLRETIRGSDAMNLPNLEKTFFEEFPAKLDETQTEEETDFKPLYYLEIWRDGSKYTEYPIIKPEITIGRSSLNSAANIKLPSENLKISRLHASLRLDNDGTIWVTALHKNPTHVGEKALTGGQREKLEKNAELKIYENTLKLRFEG